ncbi:MAG: hypothetical protein AMS25_13040 [Gemmatimonas sp. SM23_52]|nr:MAG: hypothetical protein AMS25_13040 [Gemmatimonas sp. SM23_52]
MTTDFFAKQSEWARYKHQILEKYLRVWVYKLSSQHPLLVYVDTCAGQGIYDDGQPGSPLIAARYNDSYLAPKGRQLLIIACENKPGPFNKLSEALAPYTRADPPLAIALQMSFEEALPTILERTRSVPTFVFIDPFGMKSMTAAKLRSLLEDTDRTKTEVLAKVDPYILARFTGWLQTKKRDSRGTKTAQSFKRLLEEFKIDQDLLRTYESELKDERGSSRVLTLLAEYMQLFEDRFKWVLAIPVRPQYFTAPKYYLIHGTDNPHGAAHMNDVVSTTEDDLFLRSALQVAGDQLYLLPPERQPRVGIEDAEKYIRTLLEQEDDRHFVEVRAELAARFGPDLRERHHKEAVRNLIREGHVSLSRDRIEDYTRLTLVTHDPPPTI